MAKIVIRDIPGLNGEYDLDLGRFRNDELRLIKKEAGVRAGEIEEAMRALDNDLVISFALIALKRAGKDVPPSALWEADVGSVSMDFSDEEADDVDPPAQGSPPSEPVNGESSSTSSSSALVENPAS